MRRQLCVFAAAPPRRILIVVMRRLGDALLCTALIRSVRRAWPQAQLDVLVNTQSAPALAGNPDIDRLWTLSERPRLPEMFRLMRALWRRYDLAISTLYNDRPHLWALIASARRAGVVPPQGHPGARWKRLACQAWTALDLGEVHTVEQYLRLADAMGIARVAEVVPPRPALASAQQGAPYAVVHPTPQFRYKEWTLEGWHAVVAELIERGLSVILTMGPAARDAELVQAIVAALSPHQRDQVFEFRGRAFADLTPLIESARVYVGPDTSVTHLAAATGAPTVALFGPSPTYSWGAVAPRSAGGLSVRRDDVAVASAPAGSAGRQCLAGPGRGLLRSLSRGGLRWASAEPVALPRRTRREARAADDRRGAGTAARRGISRLTPSARGPSGRTRGWAASRRGWPCGWTGRTAP